MLGLSQVVKPYYVGDEFKFPYNGNVSLRDASRVFNSV